MKFSLTRSREKALTASPTVLEAVTDRRADFYRSLGGTNIDLQRIGSAFVQAQSASYAHMYRTQPAVRSVVDYIARNLAQLGLKLYERISDDEREHAGDHPAAVSLRHPNPQTPGQQFVFNLVADFLVYDNAYALKFSATGSDRLTLVGIPAHAVGIVGQQRFTAEAYRIWRADGTFFDVLPEYMVHWRGYDPEDPRAGYSKLETLRSELVADSTARSAKTELDRAGLMPKGWIERPLDASEWSQEGMERFTEAWANQAKNQRRRTPVLEEGMEFKQASVSPEDAQLLESRRFTLEAVNRAYGLKDIPPEGEEARRAFYADVLPPYCEMLCSYLDLQVLQADYDLDDHYFEFNLDEKQMSDDRLKAITSAVGAPPLTRNEGRARLNLPAKDGGDELITPGNVVVGGKPSIGTMPVQNPVEPPQDGSHREDKALSNGTKQLHPRRKTDLARQHRYVDEAQALFQRHFTRVGRDARQKKEWSFKRDRWDRELAADLHKLMEGIVEREGGLYTARLAGDDFDMRKVANYLKATAEGVAEGVNETTREDIAKLGLVTALSRAFNERAAVAGASVGSRLTVFSRYEAAKQAPTPQRRMKSWIANTERHAEVDGETVPLEQPFSTGYEPGSAPNCMCSLEIS